MRCVEDTIRTVSEISKVNSGEIRIDRLNLDFPRSTGRIQTDPVGLYFTINKYNITQPTSRAAWPFPREWNKSYGRSTESAVELFRPFLFAFQRGNNRGNDCVNTGMENWSTCLQKGGQYRISLNNRCVAIIRHFLESIFLWREKERKKKLYCMPVAQVHQIFFVLFFIRFFYFFIFFSMYFRTFVRDISYLQILFFDSLLLVSSPLVNIILEK